MRYEMRWNIIWDKRYEMTCEMSYEIWESEMVSYEIRDMRYEIWNGEI